MVRKVFIISVICLLFLFITTPLVSCDKKKETRVDLIKTGEKQDRIDLNKIPEGLNIGATVVRFKEPLEKSVSGEKRLISEIIEYRVSAKEAIPARAIDPVLVVGNRLVTEYRYVKPNVILFEDYEPSKMLDKQPVLFQWKGRPEQKEKDAIKIFIIEKQKLEIITR